MTILLAAATGTVKPPIFRLLSAPLQERQVNMYKPVFYGDLRSATQAFPEICGLPPSSIDGDKCKMSIFIVNVNFSKIVAFKGTIKIFLKW
jgi:hypothetical protein